MERTAVVTGGSSGIGLELALALAERGDRVLACGSRAEPPVALARHERIAWRSCDLAGEAGRSALIDWVRSTAPRLDLLFNNAGIQRELAIGPELDAREVEREIAINLLAPILLCAALVPALAAARGSRQAARLLRAIDRGRDEVYLGKARLLPPLLRIAPGRARRALLDA